MDTLRFWKKFRTEASSVPLRRHSRVLPSALAYYQEGYPKYINPLLAELYPEVKDDGNVPTEEKTET